MSKKSYIGHLLIANPSNPRDEFEKSVMMIVTHTEKIAVGLQINNPHIDLTIGKISADIGIDHDGDQPIFYGGNLQPHKIHVIHSLDWEGLTTVRLNDEIGITNDISVLMALSKNEGPEFFRACSGYRLWEDGMLDAQLDTKIERPNIRHKWEVTPATIANTFEVPVDLLWANSIEEAAKTRIDAWF